MTKMYYLKSLSTIMIMCLGTFSFLHGQSFTEESATRGIDHSFESFALMGGGVAVFDYNKDGYDDIYLNGGTQQDFIHVNDGNGFFSNAGFSIGLEITARFNSTSVITGDTDNDGDRDIFITTWQEFNGGQEFIGRNLFFENLGNGTFQEIGLQAGFSQAAFSIGANYIDVNRDGLLDIYVSNHVENTKLLRDETTQAIIGFDHDCYPNFLYLNKGDNTFEEVGESYGVNSESCTLATIATDFDMDSDLDLYLANDFGPFIIPNLLFENEYPKNLYVEKSEDYGARIPMYGMGIAAGDYDHDEDLDYYITNLGKNVLLDNVNGIFTDKASNALVENEMANETDFATGWGTFFADINNDSWEDLFVSNGRIPSLPSLPTAREDANKLFLNNGDKTFTDISSNLGPNVIDYGRGAAYIDLENDGDLDLISVSLSENQGKTRIYVNHSDNSNHFINFYLQGTASNRDGYGTLIKLYSGGDILTKELYGGGESFCSQSSSLVHFGLGNTSSIDSIAIHWLSGKKDMQYDLNADSTYIIVESERMSTSTSQEETLAEEVLLLFPNPSIGIFKIQKPSGMTGECSIILKDMNGKELVKKEGYDFTQYITLRPSIPNGVYFVSLLSNNKQVTQKIIILR